eukprot:TRINITY_DN61676_c0_g1_i1.p1 TRINITY_DN61676_c0_g1~~TRINITY_DN61676_c0_g1_i1.p1  ORF type:complete len:401 (-),score=49.41 TRINITY_DN61676_c0_g1_i1:18-1220(-)
MFRGYTDVRWRLAIIFQVFDWHDSVCSASLNVAGVPTLTAEDRSYCRAHCQLECAFDLGAENEELPWTPPELPPPEITEVQQSQLPPRLPEHKKIAVMVVGIRERLYPLQGLKHVVAPAVRAGYIVDYYAVLMLKPSDKGTFRTYWYNPVPNPEFMNLTADEIQAYLVTEAKRYGARRVGVYTVQDAIALEELPHFVVRGRRYLTTDRYPTITFWLALLRHKKVELLWNWTLGSKASRAHGEDYSFVVFTRSDAHWVDDFHMQRFTDPWRIYSRTFGALCGLQDEESAHLCSDQTIVLGGRVAHHLMTPYSSFYKIRNPYLNDAWCSEDYLMRLAKIKGVRWDCTPKDWFPFFLVLHTATKDGPVKCLRGCSRRDIVRPQSICVRPQLVKLPMCEDVGIK